ncbi:hypothetical protein ACOME3_007704 [Neoechinorhynchus agilis]
MCKIGCRKKRKQKKNKGSAERDIEESLKCAICLEIIYNCVTIHPCMHSYCASCLSRWYRKSTACPTCKQESLAASKNHMVNNVIINWMKLHPGKQKIDRDDVDEIGDYRSFEDDKYEEITDDSNETEDNEDYDDENESISHNSFRSWSNHNEHHSATVAIEYQETCDEDDNSRFIATDDPSLCRQCPACYCCSELMPDRREELELISNGPQQECALCRRPFCDAYWECSCRRDNISDLHSRCLMKLKDYCPCRIEAPLILLKNEVETTILKDYMLKRTSGPWPQILVDEMIPVESFISLCE